VIIPDRYAIFDTPCILDSKDAERLTPYLSGWKRLAPLLKLGVNEPDLMRLITLELIGKQRRFLIDRLVSRLGCVQRRRLEKRITKALK
jgi:hypothetical protein